MARGGSRAREEIVPLCSALLAPSGVLCLGLGLPAQEGCGTVGVGLKEGHDSGQRTGAPPMKKAEEVRLAFLGKENALGDLTAAFQYLKGAYKQDGG